MSAATPSRVAVGVGLALAGLCAALGWPVVLDPAGQALGGGGGDLNGLAWTLWRIAEALPGVPVHHPDIQWPAGAHLAPVAVPQAALAAPVTALLGPVASVNLLQVMHVALAGGLMALWAGRRGTGPWGASAAGAAFGLAPVLLASVHNGNPDVTPVFWLPLIGLLAEGAAAGWGAALGLGAALALAPGWSPYVGVMGGLVALVFTPWPRGGAAWARGGAAAALGAAGVLAWAAFYTGGLGGEEALVLKRAATPVAPGAAGLLGFAHGGATGGGADGWTVHRWYLGCVALMGAGVGLRRLGRPGLRAAALVALGVLLALGPVLQWDGAPVELAGRHLALPGAAWIRVPGLDGLRLVWRYAALASLGVALLLAHGAAALPRRARPLLPLLVALDLLLLGGGAADLRAGPVADDGGCALLVGRAPGPVLSLPHDHAERSLLGQTCHGMPVAGSLNRVPGRRVQAAVSEGPAALRTLGFRWLLLRTDAPGDGGAEARVLAAAAGGAVAGEHGGTLLVDLGALP
jgi:hypothetical protein